MARRGHLVRRHTIIFHPYPKPSIHSEGQTGVPLCHSALYSRAHLHIRWNMHWFTFVYKTILGLTPHYLLYLLHPLSVIHNTWSSLHIQEKNAENLHLHWSCIISVCYCLWLECSAKNPQTGPIHSYPCLQCCSLRHFHPLMQLFFSPVCVVVVLLTP